MRVLTCCALLIATAFCCDGKAGDTDSRITAESSAVGRSLPVPVTSWASFRNGDAQRGIATSDLPEKLELLWKFPTEHGWVTTSTIVGDHVYAPSLTGYLYCLDRRTGKEIWKYRSIASEDPDEFAPGFKAAPRVTGDTIYLGDEDGIVHAVERTTGKQKWTFTTHAEIAGAAAIFNGRIIVGSHDSLLYCLNSDGSLAWSLPTEDRINCSAAIAEKFTFVTGCDEHMRVIDIAKGEQTVDLPLGSYIIASPAIVGDMLYVGTYDAEVIAANWKEGEIAWRYRDENSSFPYHSSASVTDDFVFIGGQDKQMHCIDRHTGKNVWKFRTKSQINSSPAIVGDRIFFGSNDENIYGLNAKTGELNWKHKVEQGISAGVAVGEGVLVVGEEGADGNLYCFGARQAE